MNLPKEIIHTKCNKQLSVLSFTSPSDKKTWELKYYRWCDFCGIMVKIQIIQTEVRTENVYP